MPFSPVAYDALEKAVQWNHHGAYELLSILHEHPNLVKYKSDRYGPLNLIIHASLPIKRIVPGVSIPVKKDPFPIDLLPKCEIFAEEWRARYYSKSELSEAIEEILAELGFFDEYKDTEATK